MRLPSVKKRTCHCEHPRERCRPCSELFCVVQSWRAIMVSERQTLLICDRVSRRQDDSLLLISGFVSCPRIILVIFSRLCAFQNDKLIITAKIKRIVWTLLYLRRANQISICIITTVNWDLVQHFFFRKWRTIIVVRCHKIIRNYACDTALPYWFQLSCVGVHVDQPHPRYFYNVIPTLSSIFQSTFYLLVLSWPPYVLLKMRLALCNLLSSFVLPWLYSTHAWGRCHSRMQLLMSLSQFWSPLLLEK